MIKGFVYSIKQAVTQFFRNKGMTLASLFSITAMLLIFALFFFLTVNVNFITEEIKDEFDTIEVFLLDETTVTEANSIKKNLESMDGVESVTYISKEQALKEFKTKWGDNGYLLDGLTENPLPNALRINLVSLTDGDLVANVCKNMIGVEDVRYYQTEVDQILAITSFIQKVAIVIIVFLIVISIVVVSNTVKLTVLARKDEILIMKYVGATNWFIRGPLLAEGMLLGLVASLISIVLMGSAYIKLLGVFSTNIMMLLSTSLVDAKFMIVNFAYIAVSIGMCIGALGSIISMRRFLKDA